MEPEHISCPIRRVLEVFYDATKCDWDEATDRELKRLGLEPHQVRVILCFPKENQQLNLFDNHD